MIKYMRFDPRLKKTAILLTNNEIVRNKTIEDIQQLALENEYFKYENHIITIYLNIEEIEYINSSYFGDLSIRFKNDKLDTIVFEISANHFIPQWESFKNNYLFNNKIKKAL